MRSLKTQLKSLFNRMNCPYLQSESAVETLPSQTSIVGRLLYMVIFYELTQFDCTLTLEVRGSMGISQNSVKEFI